MFETFYEEFPNKNVESHFKRTGILKQVFILSSCSQPFTILGSLKKHPLERFPLLTFKGYKTDYLCFKKEFEQHVKYGSSAIQGGKKNDKLALLGCKSGKATMGRWTF